jgi:hypothetical protein
MNKELYKKSEAEKATVAELLTAIYNNEIHESALNHASKDKLKEFVLEVFNKGVLTDYLNLR